MGKRFWLGFITILCASIVTIIVKFDAETYVKIIGIVYGSYAIAQTITDTKKIDKDKNGNS